MLKIYKFIVNLGLVGLIVFTYLFIANDTSVVPDVVGKNAEKAEELIRKEGFKIVIRTPSSAKDTWSVCAQEPDPLTEFKKKDSVTIYVAENCKTMDENGNPVKVVEKMPELVGLKLSETYGVMRENVSYYTIQQDKEDIARKNREVINSDNWIVCSQSIPAGSNITSDGKLTIEYGRDKTECETKEINKKEQEKRKKEENTQEDSVKTTQKGLTDIVASETCDNWFNNMYPHWNLDWTEGIISKRIIDNPSKENQSWEYNIQTKYKNGKSIGVFHCTVTGTKDDPQIIKSYIKYNYT